MTGEQLWQYIEDHQDDTYAEIGRALSMSEENAKKLAFDWAILGKQSFIDKHNK